MSKKLLGLVAFVLVLSLVGNASAALTAHYDFEGDLVDSVGGYNGTSPAGIYYDTGVAIEGSYSGYFGDTSHFVDCELLSATLTRYR